MTPHRHWFKELKPHKVPIKLADNSVVYSEGIGTVIFRPKDTKLSPILLSDVVYVPSPTLKQPPLSPLLDRASWDQGRNHGNSAEILQDGQTDYDCHRQWETWVFGWGYTRSG